MDTTTTTTTTTRPVEIDLPTDCDRARSASDRRSWTHRIVLVPDRRSVEVWSAYGDGVPVPLWHGCAVTLGEIPDGVADTSRIAEVLREHAADLARLCDLHEIVWNGDNRVGRWTDEARAGEVLRDVRDDVARACDDSPLYWDAGEWLAQVRDDDLFGREYSGTREERLARAMQLLREALADDVHLDLGDVARELEARWAQALEARLADEAE